MPLPGRRARRERADVVALVRELGGLLGELGLSEIEIERAGLRVRVQRGGAAAATAAPAPAAVTLVAPAPAVAVADAAADAIEIIEAPMVGTFYRASSPAADPYVREGDVVKQGQIVCIIEAMKLMNEIEAKVGGRIVKVVVENAQPVEYGQPLFHIDPNA